MDRHNSIADPVSGLFFGRGPLAIHFPVVSNAMLASATGVVAPCVDSIKSFICGAFSHIEKKLIERFSPSIAYKYPALPIAVVLFVSSVVAPSFGKTPTRICPIALPHRSRSMTVCSFQHRIGLLQPLCAQLILPTSTRNPNVISDGSGQFGLSNCFGLSAITYTKPESATRTADVSRFGFFNDCELSNFETGDYNYFRHNSYVLFASGGHSAQTGDRCAILLKFLQKCKLHGGPIQCLASSGFGAKLPLKGIYG